MRADPFDRSDRAAAPFPPSPSEACAICAFASEPAPNGRVYADHQWVAGMLSGLEAPGWIVLSVRRHAEGLSALRPDEAASLGAMAMRLARAIEAMTGAERVYMASFGERHPHLHVLFVPRGADVPPQHRHAALLLDYGRYRDIDAALRAADGIRDMLAASEPAQDGALA